MKRDLKLIARQNALAREICLASGFNPDSGTRPDGDEPRWMEFIGEATVQLMALDKYVSEQDELDRIEAEEKMAERAPVS